MNQKRICLWCECFGSGGIEAFIVNLLEAMDREGLDIRLVCTEKTSDLFIPRLRAMGIEITVLFPDTSGSALGRALKTPAALGRYLKDNQFDVIHLNIYHGVAMLWAALAKGRGVPRRIVHSHNAALRPSRGRGIKLLAHRLCSALFSRCATDYCACSDTAAAWMFPKKLLPRVRLIANGVDISRYGRDEQQAIDFRKEHNMGHRFALCCVGRICHQKNQSFLLKVFVKLLEREPGAILLLAGSDDSEGAVPALARELGVDKSVAFLGVTSQIPQLLWACDAFVLPSIFEGNPVSGIEAQASGIPCFFSDAITGEAVLCSNARRLPLEDGPEKWAEAILEAKGTGHRNNGQELTQRGYDIRSSANIMAGLYKGAGN